jgi:MFS family permease
MTATHPATTQTPAADRASMTRVVGAASLGTVFEYYDFLLYGSLAAFFGVLFFPPGNETAGLLASLATFGAGFAIRPLGALLFGRLGDRLGRKRTFLITIVLMGLSTALVGVLPTFESIGWWAPALLVSLRLVQGLALGGEYGGAAVYIAEHCPPTQRGFYTAWIQSTATLGLVMSLLVILACRWSMSDADFRDWGWRIPFLVSVLLLALSVYIRARLGESPLFLQLRERGRLSSAPIRESFIEAANRPRVIAALIVGAAMAVIWYTAQFYSLVFMQTVLRVDPVTAPLLSVVALLLGVPLFVAAGAVSDRIGRKPVLLAGMLLAALCIQPAYQALGALAPLPPIHSLASLAPAHVQAIGVLLVMIFAAALACGPGAAFLAELFPTRIRYTSLSLPYHLTSAWFGGFMPFVASSLTARSGDPYTGLWYPVAVATVCLLLALRHVPETVLNQHED